MSYARINNSPYAASSGYSSPTSLEHRSPPGSGQNSEVNSGHYRKRSVGISESSHAASYAKASGMVNMSLNSDGWAKLAEPDDYLHDPRDADRHSNGVTLRGVLNVLTLFLLGAGLLTLFLGYPLLVHFTGKKESLKDGFGLGRTNGTGQVAQFRGLRGTVDPDTPKESLTWTNPDGEKFYAAFTDEFETPGRTFYPGDDPFWEAVDIWYGATGDLEWYTPQQANTTNGYLQITMERRPTHNLNFRSSMLQTWNKMCYQGGYIEFSAILPGSVDAQGWWPGLWTMGNLGRPGYLGTTDGMWPYSYSSCDYGILPNQSDNGRPRSVVTAVKYGQTGLNWLSGQRCPSCTCSGEDHPGPSTNVGRAAPEIDVLEAQTGRGHGEASQSLQVAPFDQDYEWDQDLARIYESDTTKYNPYTGGVYQEAVSGVTTIPPRGYELAPNPSWVTYGMEYEPDWDGDGTGGMVRWYVDDKPVWTVPASALAARPDIGVGQRLIPVEPMAIIINLGISKGFQEIDFETLMWPSTLKVDYVRVFQKEGQERIGCDPPGYPTKDYIEKHADVYNNANLTVWKVPKKFPKNSWGGRSC